MKRVLLLNSSYEPLKFIGERDAIKLLIRGAVEVEANWDHSWSSPGHSFRTPAMLRLHRFVSRRPSHKRFSPRVLFNRDKYRCQYCDIRLDAKLASIDHIVPKTLGGGLTYKNCVAACKPCNRRKGPRTLEDSGMTLRREPQNPTNLDYIDMYFQGDWHQSWHDYLQLD